MKPTVPPVRTRTSAIAIRISRFLKCPIDSIVVLLSLPPVFTSHAGRVPKKMLSSLGSCLKESSYMALDGWQSNCLQPTRADAQLILKRGKKLHENHFQTRARARHVRRHGLRGELHG